MRDKVDGLPRGQAQRKHRLGVLLQVGHQGKAGRPFGLQCVEYVVAGLDLGDEVPAHLVQFPSMPRYAHSPRDPKSISICADRITHSAPGLAAEIRKSEQVFGRGKDCRALPLHTAVHPRTKNE
ncbi:hypothetical protein CJO85_20545 (plasmid) [Ralstonia solanacearum]|nr:hypothetical protein CJO85_20545 [Ralstonia solanacearum]